MMWKRLRAALERFLIRPRQHRVELRTREARLRFWSDVDEGRREAEAASVTAPLAPAADR